MKTLDSKLFANDAILKKTELEGTLGGNNSDVTYSDSKSGGSYDIAVMSVIDIHDSSRDQDKPNQLAAIDETKIAFPDEDMIGRI